MSTALRVLSCLLVIAGSMHVSMDRFAEAAALFALACWLLLHVVDRDRKP